MPESTEGVAAGSTTAMSNKNVKMKEEVAATLEDKE